MRLDILNKIDKSDHMFLKLAVSNSKIELSFDCSQVVYAITNDYLIPNYKIGCTTNGVNQRISGLKEYGIYKKEATIKEVISYGEPRILERIFHRIFIPGRGIGREWFKLFEWDVKWIENLVAIDVDRLQLTILNNDREITRQARFIQISGMNSIEILNSDEKHLFEVGNLISLKYIKNCETAYARYGPLQ